MVLWELNILFILVLFIKLFVINFFTLLYKKEGHTKKRKKKP